MKLKRWPWIAFVLTAIVVGLYPLIYYFFDMHDKGLLASKQYLIHQPVWHTLFYIHITAGGFVLLTGWSQFNNSIRHKYPHSHRWMGRIYITAVFLSSCAGLYMAFFANGGLISEMGFVALALWWLITNTIAFLSIRHGHLISHIQWMTRNYALTFAAVTLRMFLPFMTNILKIDAGVAYHVIAWLSWVPNIVIAEVLLYHKRKKQASLR